MFSIKKLQILPPPQGALMTHKHCNYYHHIGRNENQQFVMILAGHKADNFSGPSQAVASLQWASCWESLEQRERESKGGREVVGPALHLRLLSSTSTVDPSTFFYSTSKTPGSSRWAVKVWMLQEAVLQINIHPSSSDGNQLLSSTSAVDPPSFWWLPHIRKSFWWLSHIRKSCTRQFSISTFIKQYSDS